MVVGGDRGREENGREASQEVVKKTMALLYFMLLKRLFITMVSLLGSPAACRWRESDPCQTRLWAWTWRNGLSWSHTGWPQADRDLLHPVLLNSYQPHCAEFGSFPRRIANFSLETPIESPYVCFLLSFVLFFYKVGFSCYLCDLSWLHFLKTHKLKYVYMCEFLDAAIFILFWAQGGRAGWGGL